MAAPVNKVKTQEEMRDSCRTLKRTVGRHQNGVGGTVEGGFPDE